MEQNSENSYEVITRQQKRGEVKSFKEEKTALKEQGYPLLETLNYSRDLYLKVKDKILKALPENAKLFIVPTTSGVNKIPVLLAKLIQMDRPDIRFFNGNMGFAKPGFATEAKHNMEPHKRAEEPIRYRLNQLNDLKSRIDNKGVYILDDVITTGESVVNLRKQLEHNGIKVNGYIALVASDKNYVRDRDKERMTEKLISNVPEQERDKFKKNINTYLDGYFRQKSNKIERSLRNEKSIIRAIDTINKSARNIKQLTPEQEPEKKNKLKM